MKAEMYNVIKKKIKLEGEEITVYGLQHKDGTKIENVSPDREKVERLAEYYTKMDVSPINLKDVIFDMLGIVI